MKARGHYFSVILGVNGGPSGAWATLCAMLAVTALAPLAPLAQTSQVPNAPLDVADSVRREAGRLASEGKLDEAQALVNRHTGDLPAVWQAMFAGKLEAAGEASARGYAGAAADSAPEQMRGEAVFRLGQYHYAGDRFHLAIPQFRLYLQNHPEGLWSQEAAYWMAHACLQLVKQQPARSAYLDTALGYLKRLDAKGERAYFWPLGRATQARVHLARGDTVAARRALATARARMPAEEIPALLLLSLQVDPKGPQALAYEDSLRWTYPLSPEAMSLPRPPAREVVTPPPPRTSPPNTPPPSYRGTHTLQLGAFALRENAERLRLELAAKNVVARVEPLRSGNQMLHRVVTGEYPNALTARNEGERLLRPLGYTFRVVERE
jgi:hypothetical protein